MKKVSGRAAWSLGAMALIIPGVMAMHLHLVRSFPKEGEVVTVAPTEVRLWFSQKPDASLTSIRLLKPDSSAVAVGQVEKTDDSLSVRVPLATGLVAGAYTVAWRTMSKDGHAVRGTYEFTMAPGAPARKQTGGN
jgi:methionine-rich copper-binding protein CopC